MAINNLEFEITHTVLARFLNLKQSTLRKDLVVKFKEPEVIDGLVTKSLLKRIDNEGKATYLPKLLAFHYCGDQVTQDNARTGVEIVLYVLQNLYMLEDEGKHFRPADIEAQARKMYDAIEPEQLKLGLYLVREFNIIGSYGSNAEGIETNFLTIDEDIVTLKDIPHEWDNRIQILSRYLKSEQPSLDLDRSSEESFQFPADKGLRRATALVAPPAEIKKKSLDPSQAPQTFISYSWDSPEHKQWVYEFAARLRQDGVEVTLDKWHLQRGQDKTLFMETSVIDNDFVILICTPQYSNRANERKGGVGYEAMIITGELAAKIGSQKFIPILRAGDFDSALPVWIKNKLGVDLRGDPYSEDEYEDLVRTLHRDLKNLPPLGAKPDWQFSKQTSANYPKIHAAETEQDHWDVLARLATGMTLEGPNPITARKNGDLLQISISSFAAKFRESTSTVYYNSGSITLPYSNKVYYVFTTDPDKKGGAVPYQATTLLHEAMAGLPQIYIGRIQV